LERDQGKAKAYIERAGVDKLKRLQQANSLKSFARFKRLVTEQEKNPKLKQAFDKLRMRQQAEESSAEYEDSSKSEIMSLCSSNKGKPMEAHAEVYAAGFNAGYMAKAKEDEHALAKARPTLLSDWPPGLTPDVQPLDNRFEVNYGALGRCVLADQQAQLQEYETIQAEDFAHNPSVYETSIPGQSEAMWD